MFFPKEYESRSQDLPTAWHDAGQFYWGKPTAWLEQKRVFQRESYPIFIPRWRVQDIDTPDDWIRAEMLAPIIMSGKKNKPLNGQIRCIFLIRMSIHYLTINQSHL